MDIFTLQIPVQHVPEQLHFAKYLHALLLLQHWIVQHAMMDILKPLQLLVQNVHWQVVLMQMLYNVDPHQILLNSAVLVI